MISHLLLLFLSFMAFLSNNWTIFGLFVMSLIFFFSGLNALIKKLLVLELSSILMIFFLAFFLEQTMLSKDFLLILLTFLVIDAVLGLGLVVALSRKSGDKMKINSSFWLCS